jgi:hypothetical protein
MPYKIEALTPIGLRTIYVETKDEMREKIVETIEACKLTEKHYGIKCGDPKGHVTKVKTIPNRYQHGQIYTVENRNDFFVINDETGSVKTATKTRTGWKRERTFTRVDYGESEESKYR